MREARSINQLATSTSKAYANVHAATTTLLQEEILVKETVGHSHQCKLNLQNDKTLLYLSLVQTLKRDDYLKANPDGRKLLQAIDANSARLGILLAWKREHDLLLVTTGPQADTAALGHLATVVPLSAFVRDPQLAATIGRHTLLFGHAFYASLLREVSK